MIRKIWSKKVSKWLSRQNCCWKGQAWSSVRANFIKTYRASAWGRSRYYKSIWFRGEKYDT